MEKKIAIAIHGGAGTLGKEEMSEEQKADYEQGLQSALNAGYRLLQNGASAIDAVEAAVMSLEDNPLFNAGKGSVLNSEGEYEMDAAIMDGSSLSAGAVAGINGIRNPIALARVVMEKSEYVFLTGQGAINFAHTQGLPIEPKEYFVTHERLRELEKEREGEKVQLKKFGTVGAVALDINGNMAAATSTGGLTNKKFSRVGDTPVIGGGTYANNATCAISCTGEGEEFIQAVMAYDVSCLMEYKGLSLREACVAAMNGKLKRLCGSGGLIAVDSSGSVEMHFNTEGMYRASICGNGLKQVKIFE